MLSLLPNRRISYLLAAVFCAALIGYALYLQHVMNEDPCPLCIFQRVAVIALGVVFLVGAIHHPAQRGAIVYGVILLIIAAVGAAIAGRHVWLQSLPPDQVPECCPGLSYMLDAFPFKDAIAMVLKGSGECAEQGRWRFLGMSIPAWTLISFIGLGLFGLLQIWNPRDRDHRRVFGGKSQ